VEANASIAQHRKQMKQDSTSAESGEESSCSMCRLAKRCAVATWCGQSFADSPVNPYPPIGGGRALYRHVAIAHTASNSASCPQSGNVSSICVHGRLLEMKGSGFLDAGSSQLQSVNGRFGLLPMTATAISAVAVGPSSARSSPPTETS